MTAPAGPVAFQRPGLLLLGRHGRGPAGDGVGDFGASTEYQDPRDGSSWALDYHGALDPSAGVLVPTGVSILPAVDGPAALDSVLMRSLPIRQAYAEAVAGRVRWILPVSGPGDEVVWGPLQLPPAIAAAGLPRAGIDRDALELVGRVYYAARFAGLPPMRAVQESFGVGRSRANYWLDRARLDGVIGDSAGPGRRPLEREYRSPGSVSRVFAEWLIESGVFV